MFSFRWLSISPFRNGLEGTFTCREHDVYQHKHSPFLSLSLFYWKTATFPLNFWDFVLTILSPYPISPQASKMADRMHGETFCYLLLYFSSGRRRSLDRFSIHRGRWKVKTRKTMQPVILAFLLTSTWLPALHLRGGGGVGWAVEGGSQAGERWDNVKANFD